MIDLREQWAKIEEKARGWGVKPSQLFAYTILKEVEEKLGQKHEEER